jgi:LysR family transcriptional regulator, glycine cleavage system transcriptional activator
MTRLPPLRSLVTFNEVAKTQSVTKASENLFVTQSAVSQQLRTLEDYVGFSLFERKNNKIILNKIGEKCAKRIDPWITHLIDEMDLLKTHYGKDNDNKITLSFGTAWATRWFIPKMGDLTAKFPDINLNLVMADQKGLYADNNGSDSIKLKADLTLKLKAPPAREDLVIKPFYQENMILACSPAYFESHFAGKPCNRWLNNLLNSQLLQVCKDKKSQEWCSWLGQMIKKYSDIEDKSLLEKVCTSCSIDNTKLYDNFHKLSFANLDQAIIAAIGGMGVVLTDSSLIINELESGALVPVFKGGQFPGRKLHLVYDAFSPHKQRIEEIIAWAIEKVEANYEDVQKAYV